MGPACPRARLPGLMNGGGGRREQPKGGWEVWPLPMAQEQGLWSLCCHFSSKIGHKAVERWVGTRRKIFLKKERSGASQGLTSPGRVILPWLSPEHWPTKLGWQENLRSQVLAEQSRAMPLTTSPKDVVSCSLKKPPGTQGRGFGVGILVLHFFFLSGRPCWNSCALSMCFN